MQLLLNRFHKYSGGQRSMMAMFPSSWRSPAAGVRWFSRLTCPALSPMPSAAVFSSTRATRLVPGIGAMSWPCREQPGQSDLCRCCSDFPGDGSDLVDDAQIALEVFADEARVGLAPVVVGELLGRADLTREEAVAERRVGNESDPQLAQQGQQFGFRVTGPQGVLGLQRGDRMHNVGAADRGGEVPRPPPWGGVSRRG